MRRATASPVQPASASGMVQDVIMPAIAQPLSIRHRIIAAFAAASLVALLGFALIGGLRITLPEKQSQRSLVLFTPVVPLPPPPAAAPDARPAAPAAPPAKKAKATAVVAPKPAIRLAAPPPLIAAPVINEGAQTISGAKDRGTGSGASGEGAGSGSGGTGNGMGSDLARHSERIAGAITNADYPKAASRKNAQGTVTVRYIAGADGRARDCSVLRSSGNAALDATTCRLIEKRFRFRPALDADGNPAPEPRAWRQRWWFAP